ncbi:MAG: hypothetical protein FWF59_03245, partial [Turicibacter sp.]|nr:hypothetical protein [Turicibacter sp.]
MSAQIHSKVIVLEKLLCQLNGLSPDTAYKYSIDRKLFDGSIVEVTPWEYIFHGLNSFACRNFDHDDKVVRLQEK